MKVIIILLVAFFTIHTVNATSIKGNVKNAMGEAVSGVSMALLYPTDSTLAAFAVTNKEGVYEIKAVKNGKYLLQAASAGYYIEYKEVTIISSEVIADFTLLINDRTSNLNEVVVSGEKVPIKIAGDTVEYNASSFKTKPNAPVEDLLKQLPGVQVDAAGNIKAMGKDVNKVLVDGKEFFGNDPKVATKNLPADAINKVQTFGKKSDETEFTGIDDGEREQTINLILKDGKKTGYFGDVYAGYGTDNRYEGGAKVFKFRPKTQLAAIGQLNNINNFGFSFSDYISFNGGLSGLMNGNDLSMGMDDGVNFGQTVDGDITSGALGLNYSYEIRKNNRVNVSYMGSGYHKQLTNDSRSQSFLPNETYTTQSYRESNNDNVTNGLTARWKNQPDSFNQFTIQVKGLLKNNDANTSSRSMSYIDAALQNQLDDNTAARGNSANMNASASYVHKTKGKWKTLQSRASVEYSTSLNKQIWQNTTKFLNNGMDILSQYQNDENKKFNSNLSLSATRYLGNFLYFTPEIQASYSKDVLKRNQGLYPPKGESIDSLSPNFYNDIYKILPGITLKKSTTKTQWNIELQGQLLSMNPVTNGQTSSSKSFSYLLPSVYWRRDVGNHKNLELHYQTSVNTPAANQLLSASYSPNALVSYTGNDDLKPEYAHNGGIRYSHFDEFNMSSLFAYINASYTVGKINLAQNVDAQLRQDNRWINTPYESRVTGRVSYNTPVRKLHIDVGGSIDETINLSITPINSINNKTTNYTHGISFRANNRSNSVWDVRLETTVQITDAYYSINKERNNTFYNYSANGSIGYRSKNNKWFAQLSADVTHYTAKSFDEPVTVPLLRAELSRFVLPNNRGTITLRGFDLLDKNKSITRTSQANYLMEQRNNIISRYFMLSFNYKLSKTGKGAPGGLEIKMR